MSIRLVHLVCALMSRRHVQSCQCPALEVVCNVCLECTAWHRMLSILCIAHCMHKHPMHTMLSILCIQCASILCIQCAMPSMPPRQRLLLSSATVTFFYTWLQLEMMLAWIYNKLSLSPSGPLSCSMSCFLITEVLAICVRRECQKWTHDT